MSTTSSNRRKSINDWLRRPPTKRSLLEPPKNDAEKGVHADGTPAAPQFRDEWEAEFSQAMFHPNTIRAVSCLGSIFIFFTTISVLSLSQDGIAGDSLWFYLTWTPFIVCGLVYLTMGILFSVGGKLSNFLMLHYDLLCGFSIVLLYLACAGTYLILEIRRARFGHTPPFDHIQSEVNFTNFLPARSCVDLDPQQTYDVKEYFFSFVGAVTCNNIILSGGSFSIFALLNILPMVYHMRPKSAIIITCLNSVILVCAVLAVGTKSWVLFSTVLFQLCTGLFASHFCGIHIFLAKKQFAIEKGTILANEENSNLLYTLIPRNVVAKQGEHHSPSMLGTQIERCTIMFCSLEPQEQLKAEFSEKVFSLLNEAFSAFDRAVKRSGMFKYQHVSDWYIVACPRAAKPFDEEEQSQPYPDRYYLAMVVLADELKGIARRYALREDCRCWLKVGLHCGPVAGAVIGCYRAFYCLYGDAINTSARMCKYAREDKVHCSGDFAAALASETFPSITLESQGIQDIKGKGPMETFNISIEGDLDSLENVLNVRSSSDITGAAPQTRAARAKSIFERNNTRVIALPQREQKKSSEEIFPHFETSSWKFSIRIVLRMAAYFFSLSGLSSGHESGMDALSKDGRQWINDTHHRIDHTRMVFRDPDFERKFSRAHATSHRQRLISALLIHLGSVACQWHLVVHPEFKFIPPKADLQLLSQAESTGELILSIHAVLTLLYSLAIFIVMGRYPIYTKWCGRHFVPVKIIHLVFSIAAFSYLKQEAGWTLVFCVDIIFLHCWMGTLSLRNTVILTMVSFVAFTVALPAIREFEVLLWTKAVALGVGAIWVSRISNYNQRIQWRMHLLFEDELERLKEKIFEFLPPNIAKRIMNTSKSSRRRGGAIALEQQLQQACDSYTAVVLQLDICKFTVLSQTMTPLQVAEMVHDMYSIFDIAVQECGLFKMDTIGDAYVVAGFLPLDEEAGASRNREVHKICLDVLQLARIMILTMGRYRRKKDRETHCRIGVATGKVFAGVLGRLQPRFHIFGDAVRTAEIMEQSGQVDAVHASHDFISYLSRAAPRSSPLAALVPQASAVLSPSSPERAINESASYSDQKIQCIEHNTLKEPESSQLDCSNGGQDVSGLEHQRNSSNSSKESPIAPSNGHHSGSVFSSMGWRLGSGDHAVMNLVKKSESWTENNECREDWTLYPNRMTGEDELDFESPKSGTGTQDPCGKLTRSNCS